MNIVLIANIISFVGAVIMVVSGLLKTKRTILIAQNIQFAIQAVGNILLGGYSGAAINLISIVRNVFCVFVPFTWVWKLVFIAVQAGLTIWVNGIAVIGLLPLAAACIFTIFLDTKNNVLLKSVLTAAQVLWAIYDISIKNYAFFVFDILTIVSNLVAIFLMVRKGGKRGGEAEPGKAAQ
mgnify:CR=1 FL=1